MSFKKKLIRHSGTSVLVQQVKVLAAKLGGLISTLGTQMVEQKDRNQLSSDLHIDGMVLVLTHVLGCSLSSLPPSFLPSLFVCVCVIHA